MRTTKNLNALDVREVPVLANLSSEVDTVDVDADARIGRNQVILQANAANKRIGRGCMPGRKLGDIQVRYEFTDVDDIDNTLLREFVAFEGTDSDGYFVDILFPLGGGDSNFVEQGLIVLCERHWRKCQQCGRSRSRQECCFFVSHQDFPHEIFCMLNRSRDAGIRVAAIIAEGPTCATRFPDLRCSPWSRITKP